MSAPTVSASPATRVLACAVTFRDIFHVPFDDTTPLVRARIDVTIPSRRWSAWHSERDATWRFSVSGEPVPPGAFDVQVDVRDGTYAHYEPFQLTLPVTPSSPPKASDFLVVKPLWPTRQFRVPRGETAVIGQLFASPPLSTAGLRIRMYPTGALPPVAPYTYSDAQGGFLFRFPRLDTTAILTPPQRVVTVELTVEVSEEGVPVPVSPSTFTVPLGTTQFMAFTRT
jgi:hypothetical protein